jgi:hypothetical protein
MTETLGWVENQFFYPRNSKIHIFQKSFSRFKAGVGKRNETERNEKNGKFSETKRNGTEKNHEIKKQNETKQKATGNETKHNDII